MAKKNDIQIFSHEVFGVIRTMTNEKGETFFVGKDVAKALGYRNPSNALQVHVDAEDKTAYLIQVSGSKATFQRTTARGDSSQTWRPSPQLRQL